MGADPNDRDSPLFKQEVRDLDYFGFPLSSRTAVVQRDPKGLSLAVQAESILDGIGLTSRVRAAAPEMPILIVSGYDSGDGAAAAAVSRVRFLPKPFDLPQLAGALSALVAAAR